MGASKTVEKPCCLHVEGIGGIEETDLGFSSGVVALTGRNATNRTSLLQAIMAVMGSDEVAIKEDAEEGYVDLELDDETYTQRLSRINNDIVAEGIPT